MSKNPLTVLLVDDEEFVRGYVAQVLYFQGYRVLQASQGEEALALSESHPGPIHLLIADVMMPVMNGKELAERLGALRPEMKILFISGYPGNTLVQLSISPETFLPKPFGPARLLEKVATLLGA